MMNIGVRLKSTDRPLGGQCFSNVLVYDPGRIQQRYTTASPSTVDNALSSRRFENKTGSPQRRHPKPPTTNRRKASRSHVLGAGYPCSDADTIASRTRTGTIRTCKEPVCRQERPLSADCSQAPGAVWPSGGVNTAVIGVRALRRTVWKDNSLREIDRTREGFCYRCGC